MEDIKYTKMTVRFDAETIGIIQYMAKDHNRSMAGEINAILKQAVKEYMKANNE